MSWQDRIRPEIKLESPDGDVFHALWRGNERKKERRVSFFNYPKLDGTFSQDLGVNGIKYPLTIFFDGEDHDTEGQRLFNACDQSGFWLITHPILGLLSLRLTTVRQPFEPVENANITEISLEFVETTDADAIISVAELGGELTSGLETLNANTKESFSNRLKTDIAAARAAVTTATNASLSAIQSVLGPLIETVAEIQALVDATISGIQQTISAAVLQPLILASQFQTLIQTPALAINDTKGRLDYYNKLTDEIFNIDNESVLSDGTNTAQVKEMLLCAIIGAVSETVRTGEIKTRREAISNMETVFNLYVNIVNHLDGLQARFIDNDIDFQYFSQSETYTDVANLVSTSLKFLISSLGDLAVEKVIKINEPTSPLSVALNEYGGPGDGDANFDFFIETNKLKGNEIILLPAGKEVIVYV